MEENIFSSVQNFFESQLFLYILWGIASYIALFWLGLVIWTMRDIINRSNNVLLQVFSILLVASLNILGLLVYLTIRPLQTLDEKYLDDFEIEEIAKKVRFCEKCNSEVEKEFDFCPVCGEELKSKCLSCGNRSEKGFSICHFCGGEKESTSEEVEREKSREKHPKSRKNKKRISRKNNTKQSSLE